MCFFVGGNMREALLGYILFLILFSLIVKFIAYMMELFHGVYLMWEINKEVREKLKNRKK